MKINTNSWHYKIMSLYKWSRKEPGDWSQDYPFWDWYTPENRERFPDRTSLTTFREFMKETGTYQPVDFCTYWRNVLLWPLLFVLLWSITIGGFLYAISFINLTGVAVVGSAIAVFVGLLLLAALVSWVWNKIPKEAALEKAETFFDGVGKSLRNPELCTLVEYEDDK